MDNVIKYLGVVFAAVFGYVSNIPDIVRILLLLMVFDIITGAIRAVMQKTMTPQIAFNGVAKKVVILVLVSMVYTFSRLIMGPDNGAPISQIAVSFFIYSEGVSVLSNAAAVGVPVPDFLKNALQSLSPEKLPGNTGVVNLPPAD